MSLYDRLSKDLIIAMKDRNTIKVSTIRFARAALKNRAIEKKVDRLLDEDVIPVLKKLLKQHKDAIEGFKKGGRNDLAQKEESEYTILETYLPPQTGRDEITKVVRTVIEKTNAQGPKAMGLVMKAVFAELKGQADGKQVSEIVASELKEKA